MKFLPTKQYRIVPRCGLVYCNHKIFSMNWPKIHCSRKFYPLKNTHYMVIFVDGSKSHLVGGVTRKPQI